ncbi:MAG: hypothetical protein ABSF96_09445 [Steroidobacteraceae bacterium]
MKRLMLLLIPISLLAGCVVAPARGYYGYYGPRAVVVAPAPAIFVRP